MKKVRYANIELLRIIAMLFVVTLHYLGKGGTLLAYGDENFTINSWIAWAIQAFALGAVNIYVLIGGYFLVNSNFKMTRIVKLWLQVFFYSAGIWIIFGALGMVPAEYQNMYFLCTFLLPITSQHYWFASIYIFMCLLAPFLAAGARAMSKRQLKTCIIVLLILFSRVWRIILPMSTAIDDRGYGILWFICLFMIAAYIRLYVPENGSWKKPLIVYVVSSLGLFLSFGGIGYLTHATGKMLHYYDVFYEYNAPFTIVGAIALFLAFRNIKIHSAKLCSIINRLAGLTFGVYLLHEHILLRPLWNTLWKVEEYYQTPYFLLHLAGVVLCIYVVGSLVEWIRQLIFRLLYKYLHVEWLADKISKVDVYFNGQSEDLS